MESKSDRFGWGNGTEWEPAFVVYVGCPSLERAIALKDTLMRFHRCPEVTVRRAKRMGGFAWELKARGLQRCTDGHAFGLDLLVESQEAWERCEDIKHLAHFDSAWDF